jgi:hypothetical protein
MAAWMLDGETTKFAGGRVGERGEQIGGEAVGPGRGSGLRGIRRAHRQRENGESNDHKRQTSGHETSYRSGKYTPAGRVVFSAYSGDQVPTCRFGAHSMIVGAWDWSRWSQATWGIGGV